MKNMAVDPNYTLFFSKGALSLEDAASSFLKAVGAVDRLRFSLLGKNPKYFEKMQIYDSKLGTTVTANLTEEELESYKERLMNVYWAIWGLLDQSEINTLTPFLDHFMDRPDVLDEGELDAFKKVLARCHQRVRKFKTIEELVGLVMYLRNVVYLAEGNHCPTITSDDEVLLFYETASRFAWIAVERTDDGSYRVEGEADFVKCPEGILKTLNSADYKFEKVTIRPAGRHCRRQG